MAVRVALVGYGLAGKVFHAPLIVAVPGLELATIVSGDAAKVQADHAGVRVVATLDEMLRDASIDLVVLATPDALHEPQALAVLDAGKHVVVDKPLALSVAQAERMAARVEARGRLLSVFHNRRWDADFLTLRRLLATGTLGDIVQFETHFDRFRPQLQQRWKDRRDGGVWQDLGPHLLDQVCVLFGMPRSIHADLCVQTPGRAAFDYAHATLDYGRLRVIVHLSQSTPAHGLRFAVHGTRGSYIKHGLDVQEDQSKAGLRPGAEGWGEDPSPGQLWTVQGETVAAPVVVANVAGDYRHYYAGVRDAVRAQAPNPVPVSQALDVMRLLDAGLLSAREGRVVPVGG